MDECTREERNSSEQEERRGEESRMNEVKGVGWGRIVENVGNDDMGAVKVTGRWLLTATFWE